MNSFALVSYLADPLAAFLDRLRRELVSDCHSKAHVTILPPRPLFFSSTDAWREVQANLHDFQPFRVELSEIEVFPVTDVIYIAVEAGSAQLQRLHATLNHGGVEFEEPFEYHPHITLAQDLPPERLAMTQELAIQRWRDFRGPRDFVVDELTFVQNTMDGQWLDLEKWRLSSSVASR